MNLTIERCGPVDSARLDLGDLTVLVGPQATGKSVALQHLKLALEYPAIKRTLIDHGWDPTRTQESFLADYLGEGMGTLWNESTVVRLGGKTLRYDLIKSSNYKKAEHSVYYIPAQRVMTFENGWPRRFSTYDSSVPYVMREFSESLFLYLDRTYSSNSSGTLFPHPKSLKAVLKKSLADTVYHGATLGLDKSGTRKRLLLSPTADVHLPMAAWSAGQREFTPLVLSLNMLLPAAARGKHETIDTVIIEEPEMGLHPRAVVSFMLLVMELLARQYKVVLSTHSVTILETIWALGLMKGNPDGASRFCALFNQGQPKNLKEMAESVLGMSYKVYFFKPGPNGSVSVDISGMDPSAVRDEADWGGLTEHSTLIAELVAEGSTGYSD